MHAEQSIRDQAVKVALLILLAVIFGALLIMRFPGVDRARVAIHERLVALGVVDQVREGGSSSIYTILQTTRSQLELFQVQHGGRYPTLVELRDSWAVLCDRTDALGGIIPFGESPAESFGPYLQQPPVNQYTDSSSVLSPGELSALRTLGTLDPARFGWVYDETTGAIWALGFDEATGEYTDPR